MRLHLLAHHSYFITVAVRRPENGPDLGVAAKNIEMLQEMRTPTIDRPKLKLLTRVNEDSLNILHPRNPHFSSITLTHSERVRPTRRKEIEHHCNYVLLVVASCRI